MKLTKHLHPAWVGVLTCAFFVFAAVSARAQRAPSFQVSGVEATAMWNYPWQSPGDHHLIRVDLKNVSAENQQVLIAAVNTLNRGNKEFLRLNEFTLVNDTIVYSTSLESTAKQEHVTGTIVCTSRRTIGSEIGVKKNASFSLYLAVPDALLLKSQVITFRISTRYDEQITVTLPPLSSDVTAHMSNF